MEGIKKDPTVVDISDRFSNDLDLGIQETLTLGSRDLLDFLNTDPSEIKKKEESTTVEDTTTIKSTTTAESTTADPSKEVKKNLETFLFNEESTTTQDSTTIPPKPGEEPVDDDELGTYAVIAKELYDAGIFTRDDEDEEVDLSQFADGETLLERFQLENKKNAIQIIDNFLSRFGEDYREAFDAIYVKGVDPKEYFEAHNAAQSFIDMDLTSEDNQKRVFTEFHKQMGLSDEQIQKRLQKAIDYADLEEDANTFHKQLVEKELARKAELEQATESKRQVAMRADQEYDQNLRKILQAKIQTKEFDGIPVTPKVAGEAYSYLYEKRYRTPQGEELTEFDKFLIDLKKPENHELRVKVGLLAMNKFDLTKVKNNQESKEKSKAFAALDKNKINRQVKQEQQNNNKQIRSFFD